MNEKKEWTGGKEGKGRAGEGVKWTSE